MSKTFVPQFSPAEPSKEFSAGEAPPGQSPGTVLPLEWLPLQSPKSGLKWEQALKEKEERVLKQSREKALQVEKEAYEKGFAQGEKDGLELVQKRLETVLGSFSRILGEMDRLRRELDEEHEREMIRLIFALTRKIARHELALPDGVIRETLRAAFQHVVEARHITVHLNPKDHQYLLSHPAGLPWQEKEGAAAVKILPDASVTRGGCFLETSFGEIDATLEGQLNQILSAAASKLDVASPPADRPQP